MRFLVRALEECQAALMRSAGVLLIEDNFLDEMLTVRALEKSEPNLKVHVVRDGAEALRYLRSELEYSGEKKADLPALVLLDLKLPKVGGLDVLKSLREDSRTKLLQVVVLSSSIERQDLIRSYELGANSYIRKQVDFVKFSGAITLLMKYWLDLNERPPPSPYGNPVSS